MSIPAVIREYTPGSCCNSRNPMSHPLQRELRTESLHCLQSYSVFPIKHVRCLNVLDGTRESPRKLSQDERNTAVTSGMQNSSVYPKSTRDEAHFPFIGSIGIPCSTSYRTSGLTSFSKVQRFPETAVSSLYEY